MKLKPIKSDRFAGGPNDLSHYIQDSVIPHMDIDRQAALDDLVLNMEIMAARILRKRLRVSDKDAPHLLKDLEGWRSFWVNEASHYERHCDPYTPEFHATNVLFAASGMRAAIHAGNTEKAIALGMYVAAEAMAGGDFMDFERRDMSATQAENKGIGKINAEYAHLENAVIIKAKSIWEAFPDKRIGEVIEDIQAAINRRAKQVDMPAPINGTIKKWLKAAEADGRLLIPNSAKKGGRPKKPKK